ncbi:copper resistance protein CopB [Methylophaga sp. 42_25_T18]|nr:copper resistance protein CopB [Methylophaga sp. 42_25_T18]OUR85517.1 copper resistance protein CopB [Methylophaga sp. 42_8_T64]
MKVIIFICAFFLANPLYAVEMDDDPLLALVKIDQLEKTDIGDDNDTAWEAQAWIGKDLNKLWLKTEGDIVDGDVEEAEFQLLYSRAIAPFWDAQIGWRHDVKPTPNRNWLAIGVQGLAPYFFETDVALFIGQKGNVGLRTQFEYEFLLTQKWILSPEIEANFFSKNDSDVAIGSGLSDVNVGLRLRYEIKREFAPYIGVEWTKSYGNTADYIAAEGEDSSELQWILGLRAWF